MSFYKLTQCELCDNHNCFNRRKRNINFSGHNVCVSFVMETVRIFDDGYSIIKNSDDFYILKNKSNETELVIKWVDDDHNMKIKSWVIGDNKTNLFLISGEKTDLNNYKTFFKKYTHIYDEYLYYFFVEFKKLEKFKDLKFILEINHNLFGVPYKLDLLLIELENIPLMINFIQHSDYYGYDHELLENFIMDYGTSDDMYIITQNTTVSPSIFTKRYIEKIKKEMKSYNISDFIVNFLVVFPFMDIEIVKNLVINEASSSSAAYALAYHFAIKLLDSDIRLLENVIIKQKDAYIAFKFLCKICNASKERLEPIIKLNESHWKAYLATMDD